MDVWLVGMGEVGRPVMTAGRWACLLALREWEDAES